VTRRRRDNLGFTVPHSVQRAQGYPPDGRGHAGTREPSTTGSAYQPLELAEGSTAGGAALELVEGGGAGGAEEAVPEELDAAPEPAVEGDAEEDEVDGVALGGLDGDPDGLGEVLWVVDGCGLGVWLGVALGPLCGARTAGITRAALKKADHQTVTILTFSPVVGASTILLSPRYIATCEILVQSVRLTGLKNSRSPGRSWVTSTGGSPCCWSLATRGMVRPTEWYAAQVRPEQSKKSGPSAPHRYQALPTLLSA
jgi:hypothetical protein